MTVGSQEPKALGAPNAETRSVHRHAHAVAAARPLLPQPHDAQRVLVARRRDTLMLGAHVGVGVQQRPLLLVVGRRRRRRPTPPRARHARSAARGVEEGEEGEEEDGIDGEGKEQQTRRNDGAEPRGARRLGERKNLNPITM